MRFSLVLAALVAAVSAVPVELPEPGHLAFALSEDEFEDYLDAWLASQQAKNVDVSSKNTRSGCTLRVNGDLGQPQPVYLHNNNYLVPTGTTGLIYFNTSDEIRIACTGTGRLIQHPNILTSVAAATAICESDALVSGEGWLSGPSEFLGLTCTSNSNYQALATDDTCYDDNLVIKIGFTVDDVFYPLLWSCFDQERLEVLYVWYEQTPPNAVNQVGVDRPGWLVSTFYPGTPVNTLYTQAQQKLTIASLVGDELADKYVTSQQYLARGHLGAKTDFIFATGQRATFFFVNAAPQWQPFNAGNWNWLEQNLRTRIGEAGYYTMVYTGTWGVTQLRDENDVLVDIYLTYDDNNNPQLPVPLYYYKVVYDESRRIGTAFVGINNPYYTEEEVVALTFCTDLCRNNTDFDWLNWEPDRIDIGYSFCCTIDDFRRTVPHLPAFTVDSLLY